MKGRDLSGKLKSNRERFILRFRGAGIIPKEDVDKIRASTGIVVLDDSSPRMLLVEALPDEVKTLTSRMKGWVLIPEKTIPLPDLRPKVKND
jgi:hypothetical protein